MLVDSHAHLEMPQYENDLEQVLKRAEDQDIGYIITIGSDEESSAASLQLAHKHKPLYSAVGIHPHEAQRVTPNTYDKLRQLAAHEKVVALGEMGLDYHYMHSPAQIQQEVFIQQLKLANKFQLPVIIHQREAEADVLDILNQYPPYCGGVMHCFSGDKFLLDKCLQLKLYISIAGPVTFNKSHELRQLVALIPDERLLLETDSPYLAPEPYRGKRNEPAYIKHTAQAVATLKGLKLEDIARITSLNIQRLFGISAGETQSKIVYPIRRSLYINLTNRCTNECTFCARQNSYYVKGHNLKLDREPTVEEIIQAIKQQPGDYYEIVFCGFGEPLIRLETILQVARQLKPQGYKFRINTNGQANLIHQRNILPDLAGLADSLSISLNTENEQKYSYLCRPKFGSDTYRAVKDFILLAKQYIPEIIVTVLDMPGIDIERCRHIVETELKVSFRVRKYDQVG